MDREPSPLVSRLRRPIALLVVLAFLGPLASLLLPQAAAQGEAIVTGLVSDAVTSVPLPNSFVHIQSSTTPFFAETTTNAGGVYTFTVPPGDYFVLAANESYYLGVSPLFTANPGANPVNLALVPAPPRTATIKGWVWGGSPSTPISDARIIVLNATTFPPGPWTYANITRSKAAPAGYYELRVIGGSVYQGMVDQAPGYAEGSNTTFVPSGGVAWMNFTLAPLVETSNIWGYVNDTSGDPLSNALVTVELNNATSNFTLTSAQGRYLINTSDGWVRESASKAGYTTNMTEFAIGVGETRQVDFVLALADAVVHGNITEGRTGQGVAGALVYVIQGQTPVGSDLTNGTGYYRIQIPNGTGLALLAQIFEPGWQQNVTLFSAGPGEAVLIDLTVDRQTSSFYGTVKDALTDAPIPSAYVNLSGFYYGNNTMSDGSGAYELWVAFGTYRLTAEKAGYFSTEVSNLRAPYDTHIQQDLILYPILPDAVNVTGYVNSSANGLPINPGWSVVTAFGFGEYRNWTFTSTGRYWFYVIPAPLQLRAQSWGFADQIVGRDLTGRAGETVWVNFTLDPDPAAPSIPVFQADPKENVSAANPSLLNATVLETNLEEAQLLIGQWWNGTAQSANYTLIDRTSSREEPLLTGGAGGLWYLDRLWDATTASRMLGNATAQERVMVMVGSGFDAVSGNYSTPAIPQGHESVALFDQTTGDLLGIWDFVQGTFVPADPDGTFAPYQTYLQIRETDETFLSRTERVKSTAYDTELLQLSLASVVLSGHYAAVLWVQDEGFQSNASVELLEVDTDPPTAVISLGQTQTLGLAVTVGATGSSDAGGGVTWLFEFRDGATLASFATESFTYTFQTLGNHTVNLTVTDEAGNTATASTWVFILPDATDPVASVAASPNPADDGEVVTLDGSASSDDVAVVNWTWSFTEGTAPHSLYGETASWTFTIPGIWNVTLTVRDAAGNSDTDWVDVAVRDITPPLADAGSDQSVGQLVPVTFNGSGSTDDVGVVNYTWTFLEGATPRVLYGVAPQYSFAAAGTYDVVLTVRDAAGQSDTDTVRITVRDTTPPIAVAPADRTVVEGTVVQLVGTGSTDNVGVVSYTWNITRNGTVLAPLTGATVSYNFTEPGVYTVLLIVRDAAGNAGTDSMVVTVNPAPPPSEEAKGFLEQYWWALLLGGVIVVAAIAALWLRRRQGGGVEAEPGPPAEEPQEPAPIRPRPPPEPEDEL